MPRARAPAAAVEDSIATTFQEPVSSTATALVNLQSALTTDTALARGEDVLAALQVRAPPHPPTRVRPRPLGAPPLTPFTPHRSRLPRSTTPSRSRIWW